MRKFALKKMVEAASKTSAGESSSKSAEAVVLHNNKWQWVTSWQRRLRWSPTSRKEIIQSEKQLLSLLRSPYVQEQVNIGSGPPGSNVRWFRSASNEPRFINTVTFDQSAPPDAPTIVLVHGYGASQGFFFRNFDALAERFRVVAIDQLGWGASSRPDFTCTSTEETEAWFVDSFEEWRKAKNLDNFILLGHSLGGYVAARYALKHPEHVKHLILVGPAGMSPESDRIAQFRSTWRGAILNFFWDSNMTPQKVVRSLGPFGPNLVRKYTGARFGLYTTGTGLDDKEAAYFSDYIFHTLAARASGELCLKYIFSLGAFARSPLFKRARDWKVPTTFIYGVDDWMNYKDAQEARKQMNVPTEMIRVPNGGHFVFLDNAPGFHAALFHTCREYLGDKPEDELRPTEEGLEKVPLSQRRTESSSSS